MSSKATRFQRQVQNPSASLPEGSLRVLQITDCHLYEDPRGELAGIRTLDTFDEVLRLSKKELPEQDLILATGDLVHDASSEGYGRMMARFQAHGVPVHCLAGNHDLPTVMNRCLNSKSVNSPKAVQYQNWSIILLDSTVPGKEGGHLNSAELEFLESSLDENPDSFALVCLHHHPVPVGSTWMDSIALDNPEELFSVTDRYDRVRGMLWGHIHQTFEGNRNGVRLMGSPSTCIQFLPRQNKFGIDNQPPGMRWLELMPTGIIRSGIQRLSQIPVELDLRSVGY